MELHRRQANFLNRTYIYFEFPNTKCQGKLLFNIVLKYQVACILEKLKHQNEN
jgi:hypothetical protein